MKSTDIYREINQYSAAMCISPAQLSIACKELNIDLKDPNIEAFFSLFYDKDDDSYSSRRIALVGILLANSTKEEKITLIFQNYDINRSKSLGNSEVSLMIKDIVTISFQDLLNFAHHCNSGEKAQYLNEYKGDLISIKGFIINYYLNLFFEDSLEVVFDSKKFEALFNNEHIWILIYPKSLRNYCNHMQLN